MDLRLAGRRAVITGGTSGIGAACARGLADEGVRVGLIDRVASDDLAELSVRADVSDESQLRTAMADLAEQLGGIDLLVCCAGTSGPFGKSVERIDGSDWARVFAVNVTGAFLAVKYALPWLRRSEQPAVVLLGSDSAFVSAPGMLPYGASKGAVVQLARGLATELAGDGVRVNCVCPSIVDTPMSRADLGLADFDHVDYPVQTPQEVAGQVLYLCSPLSRPVNAAAWVSDFGYLARSSLPA